MRSRRLSDIQLRVHDHCSGREKHHMIGTVWKVQFTDEDFHIDLNRELYEECLERTRVLKKGT